MAVVVDQQPKYKHFCRICKKGFGCGRALGGHMRAHGIGDENIILDDDDDTSNDDTDDNQDQHHPPSNKRMYALRTNPNRFKNCRICENCGMEFSSWKAFLEHGKCSSSRGGCGDELNNHVITPQGSDDEDGVARTWSKGIRSRRAKVAGFNSNNMMNCPSTEEEDLANCLVLLSSARVDHPIFIAETEESCASASKEENKRRKPNGFYMSGTDHYNSHHQLLLQSSYDHNINKAKGISSKGLFECKACKKVFNSHQALGGHRASHKKVKGCFAAKNEMLQQQQYQNDDQSILMDEDVITNDEFLVSPKPNTINQSFERESYGGSPSPMTSKRKSKVHECSICHRVFSSGQALGGHKRCHWVTSNSPENTSISIAFHHQQQLKDRNQNFHDFHKRTSSSSQFYNTKQIASEDLQLSILDLNLPASTPSAVNGEKNKLGFEVPWIGLSTNNNANEKNEDHQPQIQETRRTDDENDHEEQNHNNNVKLAKLSELKDITMGENGSSSPWLQVGIGSSTADINTNV